MVAGIGGLLAFFTVVAIVVWLPIHTFDPPPSADWAPLSNQAVAGRNLFAQNGCYVCHSGYSRPQDVRHALYFLYPKISQPGDFWGSDQSPNLLGTERTGPDLSQEAGWHPDDWQRAHFYDPRFVDPLSLMPPMKSLFSDKQVEQPDLVRADAKRQVGPTALRRPAVLEARRADEPGLQAGADRLPGRARGRSPRAPTCQSRTASSRRRRTSPRSTAATGSPAIRCRSPSRTCCAASRSSSSAASAATASPATARGPGAKFMAPPPADFTDKDDACCGGDTGPGDFYYRILRGWPGTGMENFGDRLSVDDIWRVVLFIKTIPNHTLDRRTSSRSRRTTSSGSRRRSCSPGSKTTQKPTDNASFDKKAVTDPFMQEAMRVFPGLAPGDSFFINGTTGDAVARGGAQRDPRRSTSTC